MTRTLIVTWDGAEETVVREWVRAGHLPALATLLGQGAAGRLRAPRGTNDVQAWASFSTGKLARHQACFCDSVVPDDGYLIGACHPDPRRDVPFWVRVARPDRPITVIDVPKTGVVEGLSGFQLAGWQSHGSHDAGFGCVPAAMGPEVLARYGDRHVQACIEPDRPDDELPVWVAERIERTDRVAALLDDRLRHHPTELTLCGFGASHCVGHQCWEQHLDDPGGPGDPVLAAYRRQDDHLGAALARFGPDDRVVVAAVLGMERNRTVNGVLPEVLRRLDPAFADGPRKIEDRVRASWRRVVPDPVRRAVRRLMPTSGHERQVAELSRASWSEVPTDAVAGGIRLNLIGRQPRGVVAADGVEAAVDRLAGGLTALVDAETGEPVVADVERLPQSDDRPGPRGQPDLLVHWVEHDQPPPAVRSDAVGVVERQPADRSGHHTASGWFVARGPGLVAGSDVGEHDIVDLAPTVASWFDVALDGVDGRAIAALVDRPE